jgi:hypothetical protein
VLGAVTGRFDSGHTRKALVGLNPTAVSHTALFNINNGGTMELSPEHQSVAEYSRMLISRLISGTLVQEYVEIDSTPVSTSSDEIVTF